MNVIITGASKGIGLAICHNLASQHHNLAICSRNLAEIQALAAELSSKYAIKCKGYQVDMALKDQVIAFGKKVIHDFNKIDILVNNAGVFFPGEILNEEDRNLEMMIETNLYSAYHLSRIIVPNMINSGRGHVINMCSIASEVAYPNGGSYSISKFALLGFSKVLREEMKPHNVKVTAIMPGATWSHSWSGVDLPKSRLMDAEDIAKTVSMCISLGDSATVEEIVIRPQLGDL